MLQSVLPSLHQIGGVLGAIVFNPNGECLAHQLESPYEPILFAELLVHLNTMSDLCGSLESELPAQSLTLKLSEGWLIARQTEGLILMVIADRTVNISLVGVGVNTAFLKLRRLVHPSMGEEMSSFNSVKNYSQQSGHFSLPRTGRRTTEATGSFSRTNASIGISTSGFKHDGRVPKDKVGQEFLKHLIKTFIQFAGPHAKAILQEEFGRMGINPRNIGQSQVGDVIKVLSARLVDPNHRSEFRSAVLGDVSS